LPSAVAHFENRGDPMTIKHFHYFLSAVLAALVLMSGAAAFADDTQAAIEAANAKFSDAVSRGDSKGVAVLYTKNGQVLPEGSDPVKGTAAIQKFTQGMIDSGVGSIDLKTLEVYGHGPTAAEVGEYDIHDKTGNSIDHGKYVVIWRRVGGQWKLHRDIFTSNVPPKK
jgi:uncharacterized protein (TIGR02246 family)